MENTMVNQFENGCVYNAEWYNQYDYAQGMEARGNPDYGKAYTYKTVDSNLPGVYDNPYDSFNQNTADYAGMKQCYPGQIDQFKLQKEKPKFDEHSHLKDYNKLKVSCDVDGARKLRPVNPPVYDDSKVSPKPEWNSYDPCYTGEVQGNSFCDPTPIPLTDGFNSQKDESEISNSGSDSFSSPQIYPWMTGGKRGRDECAPKRTRQSYSRQQTLELEQEFHSKQEDEVEKELPDWLNNLPRVIQSVWGK